MPNYPSSLVSRAGAVAVACTLIVFALAGMQLLCSAPALGATTYGFHYSFGPQGFNSTEPMGTFADPQGVAVEQASGDVYVYDAGAGSIYKFNAAGEPADFATGTNVIEGAGEPGRDEGEIAVDNSSGADAGDIYVATGESGFHVLIYNSSGEAKGELTGTELGGLSFEAERQEPCGVAVDPAGNVYVGLYNLTDGENSHVDKYAPTANPVTNADYVSSLAGLTDICNIAVDSEGNVYTTVYTAGGPSMKYTASQFNTNEEPASGTEFGNPGDTLAVDPSSNEVYLDDTSEIAQYSSSGSLLNSFGSSEPGALSESYGVAVNHSSSDVYAANGNGAVEIFGPLVIAKPTATIKLVSEATNTTATFNGDVDPDGTETTYRFEYSTDGTHWTSLSTASAGAGESEVPVSKAVSGLTGNTTYHVRLLATNAGGSVVSEETTFSTLASAPRVFGSSESQLSGTEATLSATIYPEGEPTTYQFQYGTTTAYGSSIPLYGQEELDSPRTVSETIKGLAPDTTYHFRVIATNAIGPTTTTDQTFTTLASSEVTPSGSCPNEIRRAESDVDPLTGVPYSSQLPDCRAYEQVTPAFKDGALFGVSSSSPITTISSSGSQLFAESFSLLGVPGSDSASARAYYELTRGSSGWTASSATPPASQFSYSNHLAGDVWEAAMPSQSLEADDLYLREADGTFAAVGPFAPPSLTAGPPRGNGYVEPKEVALMAKLGGVSETDSHLLFTIKTPADASEPNFLWPGDGTDSAVPNLPSLYEYVGTGHSGEGSEVPTLVGVDNNDTQISQCGTALGAHTGAHEGDGNREGTERDAVSGEGSTVFFNAQAGGCGLGATGPAVNQLYARIGNPGAMQTTVNVAGSSGCETSTSCNVTSPVAYQGASQDGSKVFFTAAQAGLVAGDSDATNGLYECELPGDGGATPTPTGDVDACPTPVKALSQTGTSEGADVQSVVAVSEEGSHVYFTATGVLSSTPNSQGRSAEAGKDNLYVWEAPGAGEPSGHTAFIATLPEASLAEAQATPDGQYLVFTSTADLTVNDTSTVAQVLRYDAQTAELTRLSTGQDGFNNDGNTDRYAATLAPASEEAGILERGVTISEDGSYVVFQSNDALTSQVQGGLHNVYEWHDGNVSLISDGSDTNESAELVGMDATGANVFFTTVDRLVGQDTDEDVDVYDARIDGGFEAPKVPSCSGEACQGPLSSALAAIMPGSAGLPTVGNLVTPPEKKTAENAPKKTVKITGHKATRSAITLTIKAPAKGKLTVTGAGLKTTTKSVKRASSYKLEVKLTTAEQKKLEQKKKKLKLKVKVTFKPATGKSSSASATVSLREASAKGKGSGKGTKGSKAKKAK